MVLQKNVNIQVKGGGRAFVGKGGNKLEAALSAFNINVNGLVCLDAGASTGGFTDCLLQKGAAKVYAVENGKNQLAPSLQANPKVVSMEETDIRNINADWFEESIDFTAIDVSFISLTKVLRPVANILDTGTKLVCLIKPQFEVGKGNVNKNGIVRSQKKRQAAIDLVNDFAKALGLKYHGLIPYENMESSNKNQEFLVFYEKL